jgi:hypothetical protein
VGQAMYSKTKSYYLFFLILLLLLESNLFQRKLAFGQEIKEVSLKKLYKSRAIDTGMSKSDYYTFYSRIDDRRDDIIYLKKGRVNKPFTLNINTLDIEVVSEKEWLLCQNEQTGDYFEPGGYLDKNGELQNRHTDQIIKPSGRYILSYTISPSGTQLFVYSLSGYYRKPKGIGFISSFYKKIGLNYFEIFNIEKKDKIFKKNKFSFSISYWPSLEFWLEEKKVIIFSNRYDKSLMLIKY